MKNIKYIAIMALGLTACEPEFDNPVEDQQATFSPGTANFSKYVSIGNSLTSGYADGALYQHGQTNSFPNILAGQFSKVGGGIFTQPLMNDNLGGLLLGGNPISQNRLVLNADSTPVPMLGIPSNEVTNTLTGPFNNMGIPGAKSFHLLAPGYGDPAGISTGTANPYFARFASSTTTNALTDAISQAPTFFTLWIGNNDILGYATGGGVTSAQDPVDGDDITPTATFDFALNTIISNLDATGAKGVVANIASVTSIPYFTTVPHNPVPMDQATATATNTAYAGYNAILSGLSGMGAITSTEANSRKVNFFARLDNPVLITDESLTDISAIIVNPPFNVPVQQAALLAKLRPATAADLIVLPARAFIGTLADPANPNSVNGVGIPLADKWVLTPAEQAEISTAQNSYNNTISSLVNANPNMVMVDMKSYLDVLNTSGISFNGGTATSTYASGGAFSLDGVHPTAQGYSIIANKFITTINSEFGANIPTVLPSEYTTIFFE